MPDGSRWDVPAELVAHKRAVYYAEPKLSQEHGNGEYKKVFKREFDYAYNKDTSELLDWAENNLNWEDVAQFAKRADQPPPVDYQDGWVNGDKEIIVVE